MRLSPESTLARPVVRQRSIPLASAERLADLSQGMIIKAGVWMTETRAERAASQRRAPANDDRPESDPRRAPLGRAGIARGEP
jgi:hypothetical protein